VKIVHADVRSATIFETLPVAGFVIDAAAHRQFHELAASEKPPLPQWMLESSMPADSNIQFLLSPRRTISTVPVGSFRRMTSFYGRLGMGMALQWIGAPGDDRAYTMMKSPENIRVNLGSQYWHNGEVGKVKLESQGSRLVAVWRLKWQMEVSISNTLSFEALFVRVLTSMSTRWENPIFSNRGRPASKAAASYMAKTFRCNQTAGPAP
jgi:hypothetical protein